MGSYDQALPLARRAAEIRERTLGLEDRRTAVSLRNLGFLYLAKKDYSQAETCFKRAQGYLGHMGMVELYLVTGKYDSALNILTSYLSPQPVSRPQYNALYYTQKGLALKGLGNRAEACDAFLEAIKHIEGLRARASGERTSFFESGLFGGYHRAYRGMVGVLAEMGQKGELPASSLQTYGPDSGAAAFYFAEAIKARSLLEARAAGMARVAPKLPSDLVAKEKDLQDRLLTLESQEIESSTNFAKAAIFHGKEMPGRGTWMSW